MSYQFKPSWLVSSLFFILILGLVSLGSWQLNRADDKQSLQKMIDQRSALEPLSLNMPFEEFAPYQIVQATGEYRAKDSILLDTVVYQGKPGYFLITPFEIIASRAVILVNRGWLPQGTIKQDLPTFKTPEGLITLEGHLNPPMSNPALKDNLSNPLSATPPLWYYMDQAFFSQINGYSVLPLILKLKVGGQTSTFSSTSIPKEYTEIALIQDWPNYDANSGVHIGYSIQWFVFAIFGLLAYIGISFKKTKKD
ncbi:MAG: surfeit locus 1 family protein [Oleiphilaceae bacterium]|jgi:surfeit locus 1 family protein